MSLSPNITVRPGTPNQQNVGIMGRAVVELAINNTVVVKLSNIVVRKSKAGKWYIEYPAETDRNDKKDENGYPVKYPHYLFFPGEAGKANRIALHDRIISDCKTAVGGGGVQQTAAPRQSPVNTQPTINTAPVVNSAPAPAGDEDLNWDLDV